MRIEDKKKTGQICKIIRQQLSDLKRAYVTKRVCIEFDVQRRESTFLRITVPDCARIQSFQSVSFRNNHRDTRHSKRFFMFSNNFNLLINLFIFHYLNSILNLNVKNIRFFKCFFYGLHIIYVDRPIEWSKESICYRARLNK